MSTRRGIEQTSQHRDELSSKAIAIVMNGTEWVPAQSVGQRHDPKAADPSALTRRWTQEAKIFAIEFGGQTLYPVYIFDEGGRPIPEVAEILRAFAGYRPFRIASWFESTNSMLHGARPREVLASNASAVVAAAKDHVVGPVHG